MIEPRAYFDALDGALEALNFNPYNMDDNDFTSYFWDAITRAYIGLTLPAVSHLPRQAAICALGALELWADGKLATENEIIPHAQKRFTKWFKSNFIGLWRKAALTSRVRLSQELEGFVNRSLAQRHMPPVSIGMFRLRSATSALEKNLREKGLPFMLREISSYEFVELDDDAPDRVALLRENTQALKDEQDFRIAAERDAISNTLITEELLCAFAKDVHLELRTVIAGFKRRCVSPNN